MPTTTSKTLFRGAATTTVGTTLYTVPSGYSAVVTNIIVTNTAGASGTFTLGLNGTNLATAVYVAANDSTVLDIKQPLEGNQTITGGASATSINFHISGVEIA